MNSTAERRENFYKTFFYDANAMPFSFVLALVQLLYSQALMRPRETEVNKKCQHQKQTEAIMPSRDILPMFLSKRRDSDIASDISDRNQAMKQEDHCEFNTFHR